MIDFQTFQHNLRHVMARTMLSEEDFAYSFFREMGVDRRTPRLWLRETGTLPQHTNQEKIAKFFSKRLGFSLPWAWFSLDTSEFAAHLDRNLGDADHPGAFEAERWVIYPKTSKTKILIAEISELLDNVLEQSARSNLPADEHLLSEVERNQLIAVLETALSVLKSPMAERGLLKSAGKILTKGASDAVEKGIQVGLGKLMSLAASKIAELVQLLF